MINPLAKFAKNQAELDLKTNKVCEKVLGSFQELRPVKEYIRIRSSISNDVKQAVCLLHALQKVFIEVDLEYINLIHLDKVLKLSIKI